MRLDDTEIPSILRTISYFDWHKETIDSIANILLEKIRNQKTKEYWLAEGTNLEVLITMKMHFLPRRHRSEHRSKVRSTLP